MKSKNKIPKFVTYCFPSYNIKKLNLQQDKQLIIERVLNYGDWRCVTWILKIYGDQDIINVIKQPSKGVWFEKVLNFWLTLYSEHLKKDNYKKALFNINPL